MKIIREVTKEVEVEVSTIRIVVPVRYDDEDMPYDYPQALNLFNWT